MGKAAKIGIGFVVLMVAGAIMKGTAPKPTPEDLAADSANTARLTQEREDRERKRTAQDLIKATLKDPESAQFSDVMVVRVSGAPVVCGYVNARNGFGGLSGRKGFVLTDKSLTMEEASEREFVRAWNKLCVGRTPKQD